MRKSGWYIYSFVVWILAVLAALSSCLTGMRSVYAVVLLLIMPEWFMLILTANREKLTKYEIVLACPKAIKKISLICILYGVTNFLLGMFLLRNGGQLFCSKRKYQIFKT